MANAVALRNGNDDASSGALMESVIIKGDLSKLTPEDRAAYYMTVCKSVGLNPLTKPFDYLTLNGKLVLYALRACTDQLRTIHGISVVEMTDAERDGVHVVTCKVANGEGRTDISKGAVTIKGLAGDALSNAIMKAETKAKRRATLSICGLGFLDETEVETIPATRRENPHVTRPDDIADIPSPDSEDWFPRAIDGIKPLPKKDARPIGEQLQNEMHAITDVAKLRAWKKAAEKRAQVLPDDWREILSGRYKEHRESLAAKPKPAAIAAKPHDLQPGESLDPTTGEVIWGEPDETDRDGVPAFLDRAKEPLTETIKPSEVEWLKEVAGALTGCEDMVSFGTKQRDVMAPHKGKVSNAAWLRAQHLAEDNFKRIQANG